MLVGGGHKERRRSMVDGEEWRRPWRRARVPSEGPTNMEGWSMHEHRGVVGMRFWYLLQPEVGRKGIVDVEGPRAAPVAAAASDSLNSDRGEEKARLGWVEGQARVGRKLWGAEIGKR
jgi:hypothetical protein